MRCIDVVCVGFVLIAESAHHLNDAKHRKMTHVFFFVFVQNLQDFKFREFIFSNKIVNISDRYTALYLIFFLWSNLTISFRFILELLVVLGLIWS